MTGTGPKYARRKDDNHGEIYNGLIDVLGPDAVQDVSPYPGLGFDQIGQHIDGHPVFLEVKRPKDASELTPAELKARARWGGYWHIVTTLDEALEALGRKA